MFDCYRIVATILSNRIPLLSSRGLLIANALGLALSSIVGAQVAESAGVSLLVVVVMGILTGVAGGVLRDVLSNDIPILFRANETIYSVAALAGIVLYLSIQMLGLEKAIASMLGVSLIAVLRLLAILFDIKLPTFSTSAK